MRVLVVGASGFLGRTIAQEFMNHKAEVWGVYRENKSNLPHGCKPVALSQLNVLRDEFDLAVMAAGSYSLPEEKLREVNVGLTEKVSRLLPSSRLIYVSSVSVYGNHDDVMNEKTKPISPSAYGQAKLAGEAVVKNHAKYAILRLTYLYGKKMPSNSFLPAIIAKAKADKLITLFGEGERLQDYLHVKDAARLCLLVGNFVGSGVFLGATGHSISNHEVAEIIAAQITDCKINYQGEDKAPWFRFDPSWTQRTIKWRPKIQFTDGIREMIV